MPHPIVPNGLFFFTEWHNLAALEAAESAVEGDEDGKLADLINNVLAGLRNVFETYIVMYSPQAQGRLLITGSSSARN